MAAIVRQMDIIDRVHTGIDKYIVWQLDQFLACPRSLVMQSTWSPTIAVKGFPIVISKGKSKTLLAPVF